jgi:spermidine/putrescine transport system substrate-binding protein
MNIHRRRFVRQVLQGASLAVIGCPALGLGAEKRLRYLCWEGYDSPLIAAPFEAAQGVRLEYDLISDSSVGYARLLAGAYPDLDLVSIDAPWIRRLGMAGLCETLAPADFADVLADFYPQFRHPFGPMLHQGQVTGLPTRWGWIGPTINLDYSTEAEFATYAPCFDRRNRGRIGVMDWGDWPIMPLVLHAGIDPYQPLGEHELAELALVFRALFRNAPVFVSDISLAQKALLDGSVKTFLGTGSYASAALRRAGFSQIRTLVPEPLHGLRQGIIWVEGTAVVAGSANGELALQFLRHLLSAPVALQLSYTGATCNLTPNRRVEALYSAQQREVLQLDDARGAWDKSQVHDLAPDIGRMLEVWQRELFRMQ